MKLSVQPVLKRHCAQPTLTNIGRKKEVSGKKVVLYPVQCEQLRAGLLSTKGRKESKPLLP